MLNKLAKWFECLIEEHKLVRRVLVFWSIYEINRLITHLISISTEVTAPVATIAGAIIGILSTVLVFYIRTRELEANGTIKPNS